MPSDFLPARATLRRREVAAGWDVHLQDEKQPRNTEAGILGQSGPTQGATSVTWLLVPQPTCGGERP